MAVYGDTPHPRVLMEDLSDEWAAAVEARFPSSMRVQSGQSVEESEFDVLVTAAKAIERSEHLHVLALGVDRAGLHPYVANLNNARAPMTISSSAPRRSTPTVVKGTLRRRGKSLSTQFLVPDDSSGTVQLLIERTLIPVLMGLSEKSFWQLYTNEEYSHTVEVPATVVSLLSTGLGETLAFTAGRSQRPSDGAAGWMTVLPIVPNEPEAWIGWFLSELRKHDSELFPLDMNWREDIRWATPELVSALSDRASIEDEWRAEIARLEQRSAEASAAVVAAQGQADDGMWRLLSGQGPELEQAVSEALTAMGFDVEDRNLAVLNGEPRLEDLRVTDPSVPGWVCLVEVKGFTDGASPKGVTQLTVRPVREYIRTEQRDPDALWYVVNHNLRTAPPQRPVALNRDPAIDVLADNDGALIDTRDLFRAWQRVSTGAAVDAEVRETLRTARGRWVH